MEQAKHKKRFDKMLNIFCLTRGFRRFTTPKRGYYAIVKNWSSRQNTVREAENVNEVRRSGRQNTPLPQAPPKEQGKMKVEWHGREKGHVVFATCNIPKDTFLCVYRGERVSLEVGEQRNRDYTEAGTPSTMLDVIIQGKSYSIDGQRDEDGRRFHPFENIATYLNHSYAEYNCKMELRQGRAILSTAQNIPCGTELVWNYNIPKAQRPEFYLNKRY